MIIIRCLLMITKYGGSNDESRITETHKQNLIIHKNCQNYNRLERNNGHYCFFRLRLVSYLDWLDSVDAEMSDLHYIHQSKKT